MTEQQRTPRTRAVRQGVAEDQAAYRARTQAGARASRRAASVREAVRYVIATHRTALENLERR